MLWAVNGMSDSPLVRKDLVVVSALECLVAKNERMAAISTSEDIPCRRRSGSDRILRPGYGLANISCPSL